MKRASAAGALVLALASPGVAAAQAYAPPVSVASAGGPLAAPSDDPSPSSRRAPRTALWLGARLGYEVPLGSAYIDKASHTTVRERDLAGGGPTVEADAGGRFGRGFLPFLFFAHTFSAKGAGAGVSSSASNALGFGLRYLFTPDAYGFVAEVAFAYRWTFATLADGTQVRAGAPGELRLGLGAELRVSGRLALSPIVHLGAGSYSDVTAQAPGDRARNVIADVASHGYVGAALGGHFDLFGRE